MQLYVERRLRVFDHVEEEGEVAVEHLPIHRVRISLHDSVLVLGMLICIRHPLRLERKIKRSSALIRSNDLGKRVFLDH